LKSYGVTHEKLALSSKKYSFGAEKEISLIKALGLT
jgi:hypothetical protein